MLVQRIAVVQDESEALLNPVWDVARALEDEVRWHVTLFPRDAGRTLLDAQHQFDCIVLAHNVLIDNRDLIKAIADAELVTGIVLLHQKELPEPVRLGADLVMDVQRLEATARSPRLARNRDRDQELLLNWPSPVGVDDFQCAAIGALALDGASPWRVILEVDERGVPLPVLARSPAGAPRPVVATTLLLEPHRDEHRALLRNAVTMCAVGRPDVVVAGADLAWRVTVSRKLRLRGRAAVSIAIPDASETKEPFRQWPLLGVTELVVSGGDPEGWRDRGIEDWLARGGRIVCVGGDGRTRTTDAAPDADWVARRFAEYYLGSGQADEWRESIITCRAVLRLLGELQEATRDDIGRFGLPKMETFVLGARALIATRLRKSGGDSLEETVSTTIAALDIDCMLDRRVLTDSEREHVRDWLLTDKGRTDGFKGLVVDDQFDVARALPEKGLLPEAIANLDALKTPLTATGLARLRHAACEADVETPAAHERKPSDLILQEVSNSLVVAAEYLVALARHRRRFPAAPLEEAVLVDACIATIRKRGALVAGAARAGVALKDVALEAQALAMFLRLDETVTGALERNRGDAPSPMVDDLLRETARIREQSREQASELRALRLARDILGVAALAVCAGVLAVLLEQSSGITDWLAAPAAALGVLFVLALVLSKLSLWPPWGTRVVNALKALRSSGERAP
jgi:hypothetical protein